MAIGCEEPPSQTSLVDKFADTFSPTIIGGGGAARKELRGPFDTKTK
jgi:hypothetical protein